MTHYINILYISFILISSLGIIYGQGENNICMVGNGVGLDFNYDPPRVFTHPTKFEWETAASISDKNGNLLFYTDNHTVWNANYEVITNGEDLKGERSAFKGALFIPDMVDTNLIYIFNLEDAKNNEDADHGALHYSIIDKSLDQNKGGILSTSKNTFVQTGFGEGIHAIKGQCGIIWLMLRKRYSDEIYAYPFTSVGLGNPVISKVIQSPALLISDNQQWDWETLYSSIHYSYQLGKIVLSATSGVIEMYDMNLSTGQISNPNIIEQRTLNNLKAFRLFTCYHSTLLSNCGRYLFAIENNNRVMKNIVMYDLLSGDSLIIQESKKVIGSYSSSSPDSDDMFRHPISGDIYIAILSGEPYSYHLGVIEADSMDGYTVRDSAVRVPEYFWRGMNMTNEVVVNEPFIAPDLFTSSDTVLCDGESFYVDFSAYIGHDWSDGSQDAIRNIDSAGTYHVRMETGEGCMIEDSITIRYPFDEDVLRDTTICGGSALLLSIAPGVIGIWDDGLVSEEYRVTESGTYSVSYMDMGCMILDTVSVVIGPPISVDLGSDLSICPDETVGIGPEASYTMYDWSTGSDQRCIEVSRSGVYVLTVTDSLGCTARDSLMISESMDCNCEVYVPTAMRPDSRLGNDAFGAVSNCELLDYRLEIYDRWAGRIYVSTDPEQSWDGMIGSTPVQPGSYPYVIRFRYKDGDPYDYRRGTVSVF